MQISAVNWDDTKKITKLELSLCHLLAAGMPYHVTINANHMTFKKE